MAITALLMCSCIFEDMSDCPNYIKGAGEQIDVEFYVSCTDSVETKSSITASETAVTNLNLLVYHNGKLEASSYIESPTSFSMSLVKGRTYNMYALANMGKVTTPFKEEEIKSYQYSISKVTDIKLAFPMCWSLADETISGSGPRININLERMVSRINFSIDSSELEDFTVTAVRLRQAALKMYPFFDNGSEGSRVSNLSEVGDGDWASSSDLTKLNAGQKIWFYALENCQGVLLPGNKSAESKIPSEIPYGSELCTYLEMTASYSGDYEGVPVSSDNVVYRFYIGNDNCSDFNVRRNNSVDISLTVTRDRIFDESWKVSYGDDLPEVNYSLTIVKPNMELSIGATANLSAMYIKNVGGVKNSESDVTAYAAWSSSNASVATVSAGKITAKGVGTATITATYNGYTAKSTVTVTDAVTYDYQLTPSSTSLVNGRTTKFTVVKRTFTNGTQTNGQDVSSTFTWTSSNTSVATVGSNGVVTRVGKGTATITAKYGETTLTGTVTVTPAYTYELVLNRTSMSMAKGATGTIVATYKTYADGVLESSTNVTSTATWSSGNTSVANVSGGTVTGKGAGTTTITATYNGKSATCSVTVVGSATLSLGWTSATMEKGSVRTNAAIYNPNNGTASTNVTSSAVWTTSNAGVATAGNGTITAQGKGTCTITVTYNGLSASCTVTITDNNAPLPNAYVSNMSVQSVNIAGTSNYKLQLTIKFSDGTVIEDAPYTWSVTFAQNSAIATGTSGTGPLVYVGGGSTYTMAVAIQTKEYYYNSSGNKQQFSTGTSFSHNTSWKP